MDQTQGGAGWGVGGEERERRKRGWISSTVRTALGQINVTPLGVFFSGPLCLWDGARDPIMKRAPVKLHELKMREPGLLCDAFPTNLLYVHSRHGICLTGQTEPISQRKGMLVLYNVMQFVMIHYRTQGLKLDLLSHSTILCFHFIKFVFAGASNGILTVHKCLTQMTFTPPFLSHHTVH